MFEKLTMSEGTARFFSATAAITTAVGLIAGGIYSIPRYFAERATDSRNFAFQLRVAQTEAQKDYYAKVMSMCFDLTSATGTLVTPMVPRDKHQEASETFWRFYNGPANLLGNPDFQTSMSDFAKCLKDDCKGAVATNGLKPSEDILRMASRNIAATCRNEIIHGLNIGPTVEAPTGVRLQ